MNQVRNAGIIVVCLCVAASCPAIEPNQQSVVGGNNKFALELYGNLQGRQGNLFLSPYSISTALAIAQAGARGTTEEQMAETLDFPATPGDEQFYKEFGAIIRQLNQAGAKGGFELVVANAMWGQKDYKILPEFLTLVRTNYEGDLQQVDFVNQAEAARKIINDWVEKKTKDKIKELIKPKMLDSTTRLVLTNAIYFKGKWATQFKPEQTQEAPFTLPGGEKINVPMMRQTEHFRYAETDTVQVLDMPYINDDLSMVILLPKKTDGVKDLEKELSSENSPMGLPQRRREVDVWLPRFKLTSEFSLADTLIAMGMSEAFSPKADFSGISGTKDLFISAVVHKAYVEVNEEGTEAAAATGVAMTMTAAPPQPPVEFRADHPFVFFIRDNKTGGILFLGRLINPASQN